MEMIGGSREEVEVRIEEGGPVPVLIKAEVAKEEALLTIEKVTPNLTLD
jgi:hypothetical protein